MGGDKYHERFCQEGEHFLTLFEGFWPDGTLQHVAGPVVDDDDDDDAGLPPK